MSEKRTYTPEEIEALAEKAAQNAVEHYRHGLSCGECVLKGFLELGLTDYPPETVALVSGFGGGMGGTGHACGAICGGMMAVGTCQGRKDPYGLEAFEARVGQLRRPETGVYARHGAYIKACVTQWGSTECRDISLPFGDFESIERKRNCKKLIAFCAKEAVKEALKP